jgi:hypothetical protein
MASNNIGLLTDKKRICEAKSPDTAGDFRNLSRAVSSSVTCRRDQPLDRPVFDTQFIPGLLSGEREGFETTWPKGLERPWI